MTPRPVSPSARSSARRELLDVRADLEIRSLEETSEAVDEDQARDALRVSGRKRHRQDSAADVRDHRRSF
jgi:hypothetical protein